MWAGFRILALVLAALAVAAPVSAQVWVATGGDVNADAAAGTTIATSAVTAGLNDAIVVCGFNDGGVAITGVSDGTHTYTPLTERSDTGAVVRMFYTLATSAGAFTPTVSYAGSAIYRGILVVVYSHTGTASFVTESGGNGGSGLILSGTLTTTGTSNLLTVACATSAGLNVQSGHAINGQTPSGVAPTGLNQTYWDLRNHSSGTGAASALISGDEWVVAVAAFSSSVSTSSGGPAVGSVAAVGAGR
jgi:hypothetical protein